MPNGLPKVLVFELEGQRFGLPGDQVQELLRAVLLTPLPRGPRLVEGVMNLRGTIVPVLDVRQWLGLPAKPLDPADHLLVVRAGERRVALRVDRAVDLVPLGEADLARVDGFGEARAEDARVARGPDGLVFLPDLGGLLALGRSPELAGGAGEGGPRP